jgi:DNA-directed RNA polymerase subunit N (RpoN/RPB10)
MGQAQGRAGLDAELYSGLQELAAGIFPKRCASCGRSFGDLDDYLRRTGRVANGSSGLKQSLDDNGQVIVELFRNCVCGSTLMDCFGDRRDTSAGGLALRARFGAVLDKLVAKGLAPEVARGELRKVLSGQPSAILRTVPRAGTSNPRTQQED